MRRLIVAPWVLAGISAGCVSDSSTDRPAPLYPVYDSRQAQRTPPVAQARPRPLPPPKAQPRPRAVAYDPAWRPHAGRISPRWTHIVIHHSATATGGAAAFDKHHRQNNGWDELGYHFVIGNGTDTPDGFVEVGSRWHKQKHGAHCKTPNNYFNDHGIGICLVGNFNTHPPTPRQMASLQRLIAFLSQECRIPSNRITTHNAVKRNTECPGRYFPFAGLKRSLDATRLMTVNAYGAFRGG